MAWDYGFGKLENEMIEAARELPPNFEKMQERITNFITANSSVSAKKLYELMMNTGELATDMGTVLEGKEAVDCGLIDEVGSLTEALETLRKMVKKNKTST